ncbi:ABC transporter substrate-binding protein [Vibrio sp. VPAP30]|uniref:ABC transporter substrate-binding protein n=1 Tax=Vibrio sp. VPAP30 TaxID=1647102 RepID=UPI000659E9AE|nr:ABC transporter substrate-binding protein [Vibrio sp. VPAP30]KLN65042.1 ABC transporter substrate-binding protein [Vibrio sp. VPAP30]
MRYWNALAFCRNNLSLQHWTQISLDQFSHALHCTRRNAQLLIKRLVEEERIEWQSGVGRGNLPQAKLKQPLDGLLKQKATSLLKQGNVEAALVLVDAQEREGFLSQYLSQYQPVKTQQDILQIPFYRGTHCLDPVKINRRTELHIASYLYANLIRTQPTLHGDLAHSWQQRDDSLTITLRKGLKFDDGSPLRAKDVKAHFQRLMEQGGAQVELFRFVDKVEVINPLRIRFTSHTMPSLLPRLLSHSAMGITKVKDGKLLGSGSFLLSEQTEWRTLLSINPHYHGLRPWVDGVEIWNVGDNAKTLEFNCDIVHGHHLSDQLNADFTAKQKWEQGCTYAMLNPHNHPWMRNRVHRKWIQKLLLSMGRPSENQCEVVARAKGMLSSPTSVSEKDLSNARQALTELNGPLKPLIVLTYQLGTNIATAQLVTDCLKQLDVDCRLHVLEYPEFNQPETFNKADIVISGEVFGEDTLFSWVDWLVCNYCHQVCLSDKNKLWLEQKVIEAMSEPTESTQLKMLEKIEKQLITKNLYQPLFHTMQDLNVSDEISAPDQLANGWIDFNQIVMNQSTK